MGFDIAFGIYHIYCPSGDAVKFLRETDEADHHPARLALGCNK